MKPIRLKMQGFGPFLKETEIDFTQLEEGLTLITGNTGSGKTTIFDGICCALYGDTSGERRSFKAMRSKAAGPGDDTEVSFEFELKGEVYKVTRSPGYQRQKLRGEGTTEIPARAELELPNGKVIDKTKQVTDAVTELMGIGLDEFRQIVMIAQNEFMGMITGTRKEQEDTFNRIFGASLYQDFDKRVREEAQRLKGEYQGLLEQLKSLLFDKDVVEDDLGRIRDDLNEDLKDLEDEIRDFEPVYDKAKKELECAGIALERGTQLEAEYQNREALIKRIEGLNERAPEIEEIRALKKRAECARDHLEIPYREINQKRRRLEKTTEAYKKARTDYTGRKKDLEAATENLKSFSEEKLGEYAAQAQMLEEKIPEYVQVGEIKKQYEAKREILEGVLEREKALNTEKACSEKVIEETEILPDADFLVRDNKLREKLEKVQGDIQFSKTLTKTSQHLINQLENLLILHEEEADLLTNKNRAQERADRIFRTYVKNSAPFLALELEKDKPCPVCGSLNHPHPAESTEENPENSLEDIEESQKTLEEASRRLNAKFREIERTESAVATTLDGLDSMSFKARDFETGPLEDFIRDARSLLKNEPHSVKSYYDQLIESVSAFENALEDEEKTLKEDRERLSTERAQNEKRREAIEQEEERLSETLKKITELQDEKTRAKEDSDRIAAALKISTEKLEYASLEEAERVLKAKKRIRDDYSRNFERAKSVETQANRDFQEVYALGMNLRKDKDTLESELKTESQSFTELLASHGFDEKTYQETRTQIERIPEYDEIIENYQREASILQGERNNLEKKLQGTSRPDLKSLQVSKETSAEREMECEKHLRDLKVAYESLKNTRDRALKLIPRVETLRETADSAERLNGVVNKKGESFAQYVLSTYFLEVLNRANIKLTGMTDGQYRLRQPAPGRLGVEVYDSNTSTARNVNTLSGGEMFMASLALALGFSEVVEEQNGGVRLDTVFIDEGFGSLDPEYLDKALRVLSELTGDRRVAIISHVELLKERIPQQIVVSKEHDSSHIEVKLC